PSWPFRYNQIGFKLNFTNSLLLSNIFPYDNINYSIMISLQLNGCYDYGNQVSTFKFSSLYQFQLPGRSVLAHCLLASRRYIIHYLAKDFVFKSSAYRQ